MSSSDFITLNCPSCGGSLAITSDADRFKCGHCGNEHLVRHEGKTLTFTPLIEAMQNVQLGTDRTAAELAVVRLTTEIKDLQARLSKAKRVPVSDYKVASRRQVVAFVIALVAFVAVIMLLSEGPICLLPFMVFVLSGITYAVLYVKSRNTARMAKGANISRLRSEIAAKQQQLQRNLDIANG